MSKFSEFKQSLTNHCKLTISTTNVKGQQNLLKRKAQFLWLYKKGYDINFLQETHCSLENENL
jgi:exonuclease III